MTRSRKGEYIPEATDEKRIFVYWLENLLYNASLDI